MRSQRRSQVVLGRSPIAFLPYPVSSLLFVCRWCQIFHQWSCPMHCRWTVQIGSSPVSFSPQVPHFPRPHWHRACVPSQKAPHTVSHHGFESWRLSPGDSFEASSRHDGFSLSPLSSEGWFLSRMSEGSWIRLGRSETYFTWDPTYCNR